MIRAFEEKGFRIECKKESFESWSDNHSENILYIKIQQKNSFRHIMYKKSKKVQAKAHVAPHFQ